MENNLKKINKNTDKNQYLFWYTTIMALTGLLLIMLTQNSFDLVALKSFFNGLGYSLISLAIIGVLLSFQDWKNYFQERLKDIVMEKSYLKKLNKTQLIDIQNNTIKAFFETDNVEREGSFLEYFQSEIHSLIGDPYRENINLVLHVEEFDEDLIRITDTIRYQCRRVKGEIQQHVRWVPGENEISKLESMNVSVQCPKVIEDCDVKCTKCGGEIDLFNYPSTNDEIKQANEISLEKYSGIDGLFVKITSISQNKINRYYSWKMAHPTKGFTLVIHYPENFELIHETFGLNASKIKVIKQPGLFHLTYDYWVLPYTGVAYQFIKAKEAQ